MHPLLQTRGVPGTHDTKVLSEVLTGVSAGSARIGLPRFDKGLDDCVDSLPLESVDVLILEGWCMGVKAEPLEALAAPCNELERTEDAQGVWRNWGKRANFAGLRAFVAAGRFLAASSRPQLCSGDELAQ